MHPSDDVVDRSAEEGVRVVGLGLLADAAGFIAALVVSRLVFGG